MQHDETTACWFWILKCANVITSDESVQISGGVHFLIQIQSLLVNRPNVRTNYWGVNSTCYCLPK